MTKDVVVTIIGVQTVDGETNRTEVVTDAVYYEKNGHQYVVYDELPDSGEHTVHNRLKFDDSSLEMRKSGGLSAHLLFEQGNSHQSAYGTPLGPMQMETITNTYSLRETEECIEVMLTYCICMSEAVLSEHTIELRIVAK